MTVTVNKTYKVAARIQIQDGTTSHIWRFKDEIEHNGSIGDPGFELKVLAAFGDDIKAEASQTTLPTDKPSTEPKKITGKKDQAG